VTHIKNKPSIPVLIGNLPFVKTVDLMLMEGTSAVDVAKFIQEDQNALTEVKQVSLANALLRRRDDLRKQASERFAEDSKRWFNTTPNEELLDEDDDDEPGDGDGEAIQFPGGGRAGEVGSLLPSVIARKIYDRHVERGIDELVEVEALYLAQRHRIDRLTRMEAEKGGYIDNLNREYAVAHAMLGLRIEMKKTLGLTDGDQKFREQLDIKGYSEKTQQTLSNPESRHRIVSLVEKLARMEERKRKKESEGGEDKGRAAG